MCLSQPTCQQKYKEESKHPKCIVQGCILLMAQVIILIHLSINMGGHVNMELDLQDDFLRI